MFPAIPSRKGIKKAIKKGLVQIDGRPGHTGDWVQPGQVLELLEPDRPREKTFHLPIPVIYEDAFLAVVHKPGGIPTSGNAFRTLERALPYNLQPSAEVDALQTFRPVHRLDAPTTGLVVIAKTAAAHQLLSQAFAQRKVKKTYEAIAIGLLPPSGTIDQPIDGKPAQTTFVSLRSVPSLRNAHLTWVRLHPLTGRTHQLRIHLASIGHPIMGDKLYGVPGQVLRSKGLFLCATAIEFDHPITHQPLLLQVDPPNKFRLLLEREDGMVNR